MAISAISFTSPVSGVSGISGTIAPDGNNTGTELQQAQNKDSQKQDKDKKSWSWTQILSTFAGLAVLSTIYRGLWFRAYGDGAVGDLASGETRVQQFISFKVQEFLKDKEFNSDEHKFCDELSLQLKVKEGIKSSEKSWLKKWWVFFNIGQQTNKGKEFYKNMTASITPEFVADAYAHLEKNNRLAHQNDSVLEGYRNRLQAYAERNRRF